MKQYRRRLALLHRNTPELFSKFVDRTVEVVMQHRACILNTVQELPLLPTPLWRSANLVDKAGYVRYSLFYSE